VLKDLCLALRVRFAKKEISLSLLEWIYAAWRGFQVAVVNNEITKNYVERPSRGWANYFFSLMYVNPVFDLCTVS
jgi:hypothetical protein